MRSYGVVERVAEPNVLDKLSTRRAWNHTCDNNVEEEEDSEDSDGNEALDVEDLVLLLMLVFLLTALDASVFVMIVPIHRISNRERRLRRGEAATIIAFCCC